MASQEMFFVSEIFYHKERARLVHCSFDKSMLYALVGTPLRLELERERNTSSSTQKVVHPFNLPPGQKRHSFAHLLCRLRRLSYADIHEMDFDFGASLFAGPGLGETTVLRA